MTLEERWAGHELVTVGLCSARRTVVKHNEFASPSSCLSLRSCVPCAPADLAQLHLATKAEATDEQQQAADIVQQQQGVEGGLSQ